MRTQPRAGIRTTSSGTPTGEVLSLVASTVKDHTCSWNARVSELCNAAYETLLEMLTRFFIHAEETEAELKALLYIIRRTFGFKRDQDPISFNQFLRGITRRDGRVLDEGCGVRDRTTLSRALNSLEAKGIIRSEKGVDERGENAVAVRIYHRIEAALDLLKAWGTGHPGGIGTIHAGSALGARRRMEQLIQEAVVTVPRALIAETIPHNLKRYLGRVGYLGWAALQFLRFRPFRLTVGNETVDAVEVRIANGRYHGGAEMIEGAELENRAQQQADQKIRSQQRQRNMPEHLPATGAVDLGGLVELARDIGGVVVDGTIEAARATGWLVHLLGLPVGNAALFQLSQLRWLTVLLLAIWLLPHAQQWMRDYPTALGPQRGPSWLERRAWIGRVIPIVWRPNLVCGTAIGLVGFVAVARALSKAPTEFLYFQF